MALLDRGDFPAQVVAHVLADLVTDIVAMTWRGKPESAPPAMDARVIAHAIEPALDDLESRGFDFAPADAERLRSFLASPESVATIRQLFSLSLVSRAAEAAGRQGKNARPPEAPTTYDAVRHHFRLLAQQHLALPAVAARGIGDVVFQAFADCAQRVLEDAAARGSISAADALNAARAKLILDELRNVQRGLALLEHPRLDIDASIRFEAALRRSVKAQCHYLRPPDLDRARRAPLRKLYVKPNLNRRASGRSDALSVRALVNSPRRVVVLGDPGAGKSTLVQRLVLDVADLIESNRPPSRVRGVARVVVREYAAKFSDGMSIKDYLIWDARSTYQLDPPAEAFEYLLVAGRVMVLLDGLDEILASHDRGRVVDAINAFAEVYPTVPLVVTSRVVGYDAVPLGDKFEVLELEPFTVSQTEKYTSNWFRLVSEAKSREAHQAIVRDFMTESAVAPDLRANPMMLSLLCSLYRGRQSIPRNRPDLYRKCATMLFERWDASRGIKPNLPFEHHLPFVLQHLAWGVYERNRLELGVTESDLISQTAKYLLGARFEDSAEATAAAKGFVSFCIGRAWVFTDVGLSQRGDRLFQFTHRTFLEYFAASHIVRTTQSVDAMARFLKPRIARREWDLIAQLAFQIAADEREGAADTLVDHVLAEPYDDSGGDSLLNFAARTLDYLVPMRTTIRRIVDCCLRAYCSDRTVEREEIMANLLTAGEENLQSVVSCVRDWITTIIRDNDPTFAIGAAHAIFAMGRLARLARRGWNTGLVVATWDEVRRELIKDHTSALLRLVPLNEDLALEGWAERVVPLDALAEHHAATAMFRVSRNRSCPGVSLLENVLRRRPAPATRQTLRLLAIGFESAQAPWVVEPSPIIDTVWGRRSTDREYVWRPDLHELFSLFCLFAPLYEALMFERAAQRLVSRRLCVTITRGDELELLLSARGSRISAASLRARASALGFSEIRSDIVAKWGSGSLTFVDPSLFARDTFGYRQLRGSHALE